jgi:hypothetical protein
MPKFFLCCLGEIAAGGDVNSDNVTSSSETRQTGGNSGLNSNLNRPMGTPFVVGREHRNASIPRNDMYYHSNMNALYIGSGNEYDSSSSNSTEPTDYYPRVFNGSNMEQIHVENGNGGRVYSAVQNGVGGVHREARNRNAGVHRVGRNGGADINYMLNVDKFTSDCQIREI